MPTQQPTATLRTQLIDTGDGTGDAFLVLPDEVLEITGWKVGDELIPEVTEKILRLRRVEQG